VNDLTILFGKARRLAGTALEGLSEEEKLDLVVDGQHTSTGDTTENVGTSTLEERLDTLSGDDLATSIEGTLVLDGLFDGSEMFLVIRDGLLIC
jgi:hypothetical protein